MQFLFAKFVCIPFINPQPIETNLELAQNMGGFSIDDLICCRLQHEPSSRPDNIEIHKDKEKWHFDE